MKTYKNDGFCPNCGIGINNQEVSVGYCQNCEESFEKEEV